MAKSKPKVTIQQKDLISSALEIVNKNRKIEDRFSTDDITEVVNAFSKSIENYLSQATKETDVLVKIFEGFQVESSWHESKKMQIGDKYFDTKEGLRTKAKTTYHYSTTLGRDKG